MTQEEQFGGIAGTLSWSTFDFLRPNYFPDDARTAADAFRSRLQAQNRECLPFYRERLLRYYELLARYDEARWLLSVLDSVSPERQAALRGDLFPLTRSRVQADLEQSRARLLSWSATDPALASARMPDETDVEELRADEDLDGISVRIERLLSGGARFKVDIGADERLESLVKRRALIDVAVVSAVRPRLWACIAFGALALCLMSLHLQSSASLVVGIFGVCWLSLDDLWSRYKDGRYGQDSSEIKSISRFVVHEITHPTVLAGRTVTPAADPFKGGPA